MKLRYILPLLIFMLATPYLADALRVKDVVFTTKDAGKVVFNHNFHIRQKGIDNNCKACHNVIFDMKSKKSYTMADMEKGKSCGACHNGKGAFTLKECVKCHLVKDITFKVKATGPTVFSHAKHVTAYQCSACHPKIYTTTGKNARVTMAEMEKGKSCGACHNSKTAFSINDCGKCHTVKDVVFKIKETGPVTFSHGKHTVKYRCEECHGKVYPAGSKKRFTMAEMDKGKSCGACHNGKTVFSVSDCSKCHPVKDIHYKVKNAGDATFKHSVHLGMYSCKDCHTKIYPLGRSSKAITMMEMDKKKSCGACHDGKTAFTVRESCVKCHDM